MVIERLKGFVWTYKWMSTYTEEKISLHKKTIKYVNEIAVNTNTYIYTHTHITYFQTHDYILRRERVFTYKWIIWTVLFIYSL